MTVLAGTAVAGLKQTPAPGGATAQQTQASGVIVGRVVDADSGAAIPGAIVELYVTPAARPQSQGASAAATPLGGSNTLQPKVLTNRDGQFAFSDIPAGQCRFSVQVHGYSGGGYHQAQVDGPSETLDLAAGQRVGDVTLKAWKDGAITGRVLDEAGEPAVAVSLFVLRRARVNGETTWQRTGEGRTDDRGVYRVARLRPGDYVVEVPTTRTTTPIAALDAADQQAGGDVSAAPVVGALVGALLAGDRSGQQVGNLLLSTGSLQGVGAGPAAPAATADGRVSTYPTVFSPGSTLLTRATVITLHSGEERPGVDIQLTLAPSFRISGVLTDLDGSPASNMALRLVALDDQNNADATSIFDVAMTVTGPHGDFTMLAVPPGQYMVSALRSALGRGARGPGAFAGANAAPPAWAKAPVSVADKDVSGLSLTLRTGLNVTGHVVFAGEAPRPTEAQLGSGGGIRLQPSGAGMQSGRSEVGSIVIAQVNTDGSFAMRGAMPGHYMMLAPGWPPYGTWIAKSISVDGRDVSDLPIDLDAGDLSNVVVTFTDRPAALSGTVRRQAGDPDPTAVVVGFPVDPHAWGSPGIHTFSARATTSGAYTAQFVAPGEYNVVAISNLLEKTWQSPDVLPRIAASAVRVRVEDGAHATQDLTTSAIR
jgi:hypothetical protein